MGPQALWRVCARQAELSSDSLQPHCTDPRKASTLCTENTQPENRVAGAQRLWGTTGGIRGCRHRRAVAIPKASHSQPPPESSASHL